MQRVLKAFPAGTADICDLIHRLTVPEPLTVGAIESDKGNHVILAFGRLEVRMTANQAAGLVEALRCAVDTVLKARSSTETI